MGEQTGEYRSLDAMPGVAPPEQADGAALTIEVDGEAFECRPDGRGGTHYDWLSGSNDGYGCTVRPTKGFAHSKIIADSFSTFSIRSSRRLDSSGTESLPVLHIEPFWGLLQRERVVAAV